MTKTRITKITKLLFPLLITSLLTGCSKEPTTQSEFLLNTVVTITIFDDVKKDVLESTFNECKRYENLFSKTLKDSDISKLNAVATSTPTMTSDNESVYGSLKVSDETIELLEYGLKYSKLSNGFFDITVGPATKLWNFTAKNPKLPDSLELKKAVSHINYKKLKIDGNTVSFLSPNMSLDLGAIAKGYIADKLKIFLKDNNVKHAIINLGGNVLCFGGKPNGDPFNIGIQKPFNDRNETAAIMNIKDYSVVSSGVYERHFILNNKNYHHILNPKTGYSYDNGLTSVTILSKNSVDGDGLSTACFSLGLEKGMNLIDSINDCYAVFITDDQKLHYSKGFKDNISFSVK